MNLRVELGKVEGRELASPSLIIEIFSAQAVDVCLKAGLEVVEDCCSV